MMGSKSKSKVGAEGRAVVVEVRVKRRARRGVEKCIFLGFDRLVGWLLSGLLVR